MRNAYGEAPTQGGHVGLPALSRRGFGRLAGLTVGVAGLAALGLTVRPGEASALPAFPTPGGTSVIYVPHQDDDALSFGLYIAAQVRAGNDVHVVLYTDGCATGVCGPDPEYDLCTAPNEFDGVPVEEFVKKRDKEFLAACAALGVPPGNIHIGTPGMTRAHDAKVTLAYTDDVLRYWINRFPKATHVTYSWIDTNPDHSLGGRALRAIVANGDLPAAQSLFAIARWYWQYDYPGLDPVLILRRNELRAAGGFPLAVHMFKTTDEATNAAYRESIEAYRVPYDIGNRSVPQNLAVAEADPSSLLHGYAAGRYSTRMTLLTERAGANARVGGVVQLLDYPGFGSLDNPLGLAQALDASKVANPMMNANLTIQVLDRTGRVVGTSTTKVKAAGRFDAVLRLPKNAVSSSVRVSYPGGTGTGPVTSTKALPAAARPRKATTRKATPSKVAKARRR